jgi:D-alanine-D-alanine ligase
MKIAIIFDALAALGPEPDVGILESVERVESALVKRGHTVTRVPVAGDARWIERLRRGKFDLVYNLCEGIDGVAEVEPPAIGALELLCVPFTGSGSWTLALCLRKSVVNMLLDRAGLPVPRWTVLRPGDQVTSVGFPAICKPAAEDASIGIEQKSVVRSMRALRARVNAMHQRWDEVVVQRFVNGREVNVGILGDRVLPMSEIDFGGLPRGLWPIVSYRSKWITGSDEDEGTKPVCPAPLAKKLRDELEQLALEAWSIVGGQGYGRVDFRVDAEGRPWLLEVNPNADISPDAGLPRMAAAAGMEYDDLINEIATLAFGRETVAPAEAWGRALQLSGVV